MYKQVCTFNRVKPIAVFDLETNDLGGPFIIGAYTYEGNTGDVVYFDNMTSFMLDVVLSDWGRQFDWYAHNGAKYDYLYAMYQATRHAILDAGYEIQPVMSGKACRGLKIYKGEHVWRLKDSYCLTFMSLKDFSKTFSPDYVKKDFDWEKERFDATNPEHLDYLRHDVLSLLSSMIVFQDLMREHFNTPLSWTIAGNAVKAWRQGLPKRNDYVPLTNSADGFIRRAYRGGLCIVRNALQHDNAYYYDLNSAYAWSMLQGVPVGNPSTVSEEQPDVDGFYRVYVDTGASEIPVIGFLSEHGTIYPLGRFTTHTTSIEIALARRLGHTVEVIEGIVFPRHDFPFTGFVTACRDMRMRDYFGPLGIMAKGLQNNLYGKFGQARQQEYYKLQYDEPVDDGIWFAEVQGKDYRDTAKELWYQMRDGERDMAMVHWAAWITAQVRVRLMESILAVGWDRFIYCDTDSIVVNGCADDVLDIGKEYGQWKKEYGPCTIWPIASKTYLLRTEDEDYEWLHKMRDASYVVHAKGIPRRLLTADALLAAFESREVEVTFTTISSMLRVIRGAPIGRKMSRKISRPQSAINAVFDSKTRRFKPHRLNFEKDEHQQLNIARGLQLASESKGLSWLRQQIESNLQGS